MEKKMENNMETGVILGFYRVIYSQGQENLAPVVRRQLQRSRQ